MAQQNATLADAYGYASALQRSWLGGNISRYDIVEQFIDDLLQHRELEDDFIHRTNILVTTTGKGVVTEKPKTVEELRHHLVRTTFM